MVVVYLNSVGYTNSTMTLQDEANMKFTNGKQRQSDFRALKKLILGECPSTTITIIPPPPHTHTKERLSKGGIFPLCVDGAWAEVEKLIGKLGLKNHKDKAFLYAVYKQQFLEHIENGEFQKAFTYLTKRLKPLEKMQAIPGEFKDLCYLLTCNAVQDAPSFKNWEGITNAREKLVEEFQDIWNDEALEQTGESPRAPLVSC